MSDMSGEFLESVQAEQASEPELETTSEQLAEIEGQARHYTPLEGWRLVPLGETRRDGDQWAASVGRYIRPIEPDPEPQPQPQPIQVCEGRWRTRNGDIYNVIPTPDGVGLDERFPWWGAAYGHTWRANGQYHFGRESPLDLVEYLGSFEPEPEAQPPMLQDADGRIRLLKECNDNQAETIRRLRAEVRDSNMEYDRIFVDLETSAAVCQQLQKELGEAKVELAGAIQGRDLFAAANREQADKIGALQGEAHVLNMEIGGLERQLVQRDARIRDLETLHAAASQAVADAGKANDKLQQANDKLAQLEALQPMAATSRTAQTMVRDMLGHMRCLLALHHTTDRRSFCTLLESILEVFDDAECDDDGDETSEAEQG